MIKHTKIAIVAALFGALALGALACGEEAPPAPPEEPPAEPEPPATPEPPAEPADVELTAAEQNELRTQFAAAAQAEITAANAEQVAAALEAEIAADLAAGE
jgi:hypothetical protein